MKKLLARVLAAAVILGSAAPSWAASADDFKFFEEEAKVVTASRRSQSVLDVPAAVDVITSEDIEASGATSLTDLLRFREGMNVIDGHTPHSHREVVSMRGFAEGFSRNMLVLVDGRNAYSSNSGGTYWAQLPVQIQDIERIEIVRGPNAALYGSGAGLGVINIITKKPAGRTSGSLEALGGNRGTAQTAESFDGAAGSFEYHLSHTYHNDRGFVAADPAAPANDSFQTNKLNFRSHWSPKPGMDLELFAGSSWNNEDQPMDGAPPAREHYNEHFEMGKFSTKLAEGSQLEILSSYKDAEDTFGPTANPAGPLPPGNPGNVDHTRDYQYDEEIMHRLDWNDGRMNTTYGFNYEETRLFSAYEFAGRSPAEYQVYRGFLNQNARVNDYLSLSGAFAWEATDRGSPHPNYQVAAMLKPSPSHAFHLNYSVAHTIPTLRLLDVFEQRDPTTLRVGNPGLKPETLESYETGYRGEWLDRHLETDANLYYTVVKNIDDDVNLGPWPVNPAVAMVGFVNTNRAITRGAETGAKYGFTPSRSMYVNYTFESVTDWSGNIGEVVRNTPVHALNFGAMADVAHGLSASFNMGYKDAYVIANQTDQANIPAYWRLDARLAYVIPRHKDVKVFITGQNLLKPQHLEFADDLAVPRTFSGGFSVKF